MFYAGVSAAGGNVERQTLDTFVFSALDPLPPASAILPPVAVLPATSNTGVLSISVATLIDGNFSQSTSAVLSLLVDPLSRGNSSSVIVSGCATLSGTLNVTLTSTPSSNQLPVLSSACLTGQFQQVSLSGPGSSCVRSSAQDQLITSQQLTLFLHSCQPGSSGSVLSLGAIIGIVVGAVLALLVAGVVIFLLARPDFILRLQRPASDDSITANTNSPYATNYRRM
jgi:hypothetical protein